MFIVMHLYYLVIQIDTKIIQVDWSIMHFSRLKSLKKVVKFELSKWQRTFIDNQSTTDTITEVYTCSHKIGKISNDHSNYYFDQRVIFSSSAFWLAHAINVSIKVFVPYLCFISFVLFQMLFIPPLIVHLSNNHCKSLRFDRPLYSQMLVNFSWNISSQLFWIMPYYHMIKI